VARFNTKHHQAKSPVALVTSPIATVSKTPDTRTFQGAPGWTRTPQSELFLLSTGAFLDGKGSFYESGNEQDARHHRLVQQLAVEDFDWFANFVKWLRTEGNMRTASLMAAADGIKARLDAGLQAPLNSVMPTNREVIDSVLRRPDEPGELLAYWTSMYGRRVPKPVKRGIADAVRRLYSGKSLLKYDTASHGYRFGDVLNLVHAAPDPDKPWQGELFRYALDRRHHAATAEPPESNRTLQLNAKLLALPVEERRAFVYADDAPTFLAEAGFTWEMLAGWLQGPLDKRVWEAMIPSMGIMALCRNLRNFDETGVSDDTAQLVINRLKDPEQIRKSRMLPFRFHSAYREAPSLRWGHALDAALTASLVNVPSLDGRTLIMVDTSSSMEDLVSGKSTVKRWDLATLFGVALGHRCTEAEVVSFSSLAKYWGDPSGADTKVFSLRKGESLLRSIERWKNDGFFLGGGTETTLAVKRHFSGHSRVVIITDEQSGSVGDPGAVIPRDTPLYTWNIAGYAAGHGQSGSNARFTFGGLTDSAFRLIPLLEAGASGVWPWELNDQG